MIGLLWVVEDQAGKHYLAKTKARLAAEGFDFDPEKLLPSRPPDEENFCAVPSLVSLGKNDISNPTVAALRELKWVPSEFVYPGKRTSFTSPASPQPVDWKAAYDVLRTRYKKLKLPDAPGREVEVLASALETRLKHVFEELEAALERPKAVLLDVYRIEQGAGLSAGSFSTYDDIVTLSRLLRLKTHLNIERSQDEQACSGIIIRLRLVEAMDSGISGIAFFSASRACGVMEEINADVWLGLEKRFFNKSQIERLRDHLASFSWIESMLKCYRYELAKTESNWQEIKMNRTILFYRTSMDGNEELASFLPNGLIDFNQAKWLNIQMDWLTHLEKNGEPYRFHCGKWGFTRKTHEGFALHNLEPIPKPV